jgi:FAD/FMN-containing dehydrogenase
MSSAVLDRLRALLGGSAVSCDPDGLPRAVPDSVDAVAATLRVAEEAAWRVRIEGHGSWLPPDAPADFALTTRGLDRILAVHPADLVATVEAGVAVDVLQRRLAADGMWLALDPPGRPDRTIGSVLATATAGALRAGFGPVRDHVLGCTAVTGDGRVIRPGGTVVKNVAGYDLTKLQVGGFGAFGVLTTLHLRLRTRPDTEATLLARGPRDHLTSAARDLIEAHAQPAALELVSPTVAADSDWVLAARCAGSAASVDAERALLLAATDLGWGELDKDRAHAFWHLATHAASGAAVTLRLGVLAPGLDEMIDLVGQHLDEGLIWAGALQGGLRWAGEASPDRLRTLRGLAAAREVPLTVERAPWAVRHAIGHFGAYREGVGPLVAQLREVFDPSGRLVVAIDGGEG